MGFLTRIFKNKDAADTEQAQPQEEKPVEHLTGENWPLGADPDAPKFNHRHTMKLAPFVKGDYEE